MRQAFIVALDQHSNRGTKHQVTLGSKSYLIWCQKSREIGTNAASKRSNSAIVANVGDDILLPLRRPPLPRQWPRKRPRFRRGDRGRRGAGRVGQPRFQLVEVGQRSVIYSEIATWHTPSIFYKRWCKILARPISNGFQQFHLAPSLKWPLNLEENWLGHLLFKYILIGNNAKWALGLFLDYSHNVFHVHFSSSLNSIIM